MALLPASARELTDEDWQLVELARSAIDANTDAGPDQDGVHTMGAAVRASDGRMFAGVNLFHFTGGPCAELVALGAARADGAREFTTIVAVGNHGRGPVGPCGRDRQVLFDYHPDIRVLLPTERGVRSVLISDLMPLASRLSRPCGPSTRGSMHTIRCCHRSLSSEKRSACNDRRRLFHGHRPGARARAG